MISPGYFKEQFISTFGIIEYWFSKLGQWFGGFLLIKFLVNVIVITFRSFELHRVTGASWGIGKILLSATYNLFTLSMISTLNQIPQHNPMTSSTPPDKNYNEHETLEHIYPAITRPLHQLSIRFHQYNCTFMFLCLVPRTCKTKINCRRNRVASQ